MEFLTEKAHSYDGNYYVRAVHVPGLQEGEMGRVSQ